MRSLVTRLLLALASTAFALVLAEGVLRLVPGFDPHLGGHDRLFAFDPDLGWGFVPEAEEMVVFPGEYRRSIRINANGYRDVSWTDTPGARRIAILGDSFTSNLGVEADSVFTRHLERQLGPGVVVRNYGVNGYNQVQQVLQLERQVLDWDPDLVLVVHYPRNDLDENAARHWTARYERPRARLEDDGLHFDLDVELARHETPPPRRIETLRLRVLARTLWYTLRPNAAPLHRQPPERRWSRAEWTPNEKPAFDLTVALFERMQTLCADADVGFGVVLAPSLWQVQADAWNRIADDGMVREEPQAMIGKILRAWGIDVLDLLPLLRERAASTHLYYPSEQHWTTQAQRPVATAIADWIE